MDSVVDPAAAAPLPTADAGGASPAQIVAQLRRHALAIGLCALLGACGAYVYAHALPKSYTAAAAVAVEGDRMAIPELQGALRAENEPDPMPVVHTEVQALSARQLVQGVTRQLQLDRDPEFNGALRPPTALDRLKDKIRGWLPGGGGGPDGPAVSDDALIGGVMNNLVVSQDNRSLVIGIAFTAHDPALAARFVNTLIKNYIDARAQRRVSANVGASATMSERIDQVRGDIEKIESQMRALRDRSGLVGLRAGSVGQQQVEDLTTAASRATLDRSQIEANYERASALASSGSSDALASVLGSETISRLRAQESEAAAKVADLSQRYGPAYPTLRSAEADLAAARREIAGETRRIVASLATQLRVARAHEADVLGQLDRARHAGVAAQNTQAQLDQLSQDAATRRDLYRTLLERAQQTATQPTGTETPDVRVLSEAVPPGLPSAPNMKLAAGFGGLGGGLLACMAALAFTRQAGRPDAAAFARQAGLSVAATLSGRAVRSGLCNALALGGGGADADALRLARTRLGQLSRTSVRVLAVVGADPGVASSAVAGAYARAAARDGQHVLLVDGDPGGSGLSRVLGLPGGRAADALSGAADWRDCIVADRVPNLDTLLEGGEAGRDGAFHHAVGLENLLAEARGEYDQIVLGAPAASRPSAVAMMRSAEVTVLVLDERGLRAEPAMAVVSRLRGLSRNRLAAVLLSAK